MRWLIAAGLSLLPLAASAAQPGVVVVARAAHDPLLIWDASPTIYTLIAQSTPDSEVNAQLEQGARRAADSKRASLQRATGMLTVRVVYQANVAPQGTHYKVATMGRATTYAVLERPVHGGPDHFRVLGKLPR